MMGVEQGDICISRSLCDTATLTRTTGAIFHSRYACLGIFFLGISIGFLAKFDHRPSFFGFHG